MNPTRATLLFVALMLLDLLPGTLIYSRSPTLWEGEGEGERWTMMLRRRMIGGWLSERYLKGQSRDRY